MTYQQALNTLPAGHELSSTFGCQGEGGYTEYRRTPDGRRFVVGNGSYEETAPFVWSVKEVGA